MRLSRLMCAHLDTYLSLNIRGDMVWSSRQLGKLLLQASTWSVSKKATQFLARQSDMA